MFLPRKKLFASFLIFVALVTLGWFVFFEYSVRWLEKQIEIVTTDLTKKGYTISYSKVEISGNPLFLSVSFKNPSLKDPKGFLQWNGSELLISLQPWQPYLLTCTFPGDQSLLIHQNIPVSIGLLKLERAVGTFALDSQGALKELNFTIEQVKSFVDSKPQPVFSQKVSLKATNLIDPLNLQFSFSANLLNLESLFNMERLDHVCVINLDGSLSGYQNHELFPKSLADWRDGGGVLEVSFLKFSWLPIIVEAKGTLTLDQDMYPLGAFSSKVSGYQDALVDMVKLGWVKKKKAAGASFVLDLFSVSDEYGTKHLTVPVTLQNRVLSVGPAPLAKLRPLQNL
ncbi:MAG: DUF2125 domain-containing protein [Proteobacteria bacterium]|nr:DUF2125 domain-containing protein [Pseudomonadota bacterium]